jgi:hypothetical protein
VGPTVTRRAEAGILSTVHGALRRLIVGAGDPDDSGIMFGCRADFYEMREKSDNQFMLANTLSDNALNAIDAGLPAGTGICWEVTGILNTPC